jgi:hypothetical protein
VKAPPRYLDRSPRKLKTQEGIERSRSLNRSLAATDRYSDQSPGGEVGGSGVGEATCRQENPTNDMRVRLTDEVSRLGSGESP